ncbi:hypothetical protein phytr_8810 [Candidatus Phycorickettsia trachydisci]|uniref:Uncharacterized protein n=1 Tax=Candidatus Phycorickettsia trachydisci TaxID=2115978 RepID=A0A2P1P958_9RICK|nr:hypothetical protein phytr_8810 [Candidatus Phycorickettsia trachydisci]
MKTIRICFLYLLLCTVNNTNILCLFLPILLKISKKLSYHSYENYLNNILKESNLLTQNTDANIKFIN